MLRIAKVGLEKLSLYLSGKMLPEAYEEYKNLLNPNPSTEAVMAAIDAMNIGTEEDDGATADDHLRDISLACGNNIVAHTLVQIAALVYADPAIGALLGRITPAKTDYANLERAFFLSGVGGHPIDHMDLILDAYKRLEIYFLENEDVDILRKPFVMDTRLAAWLQGEGCMDKDLSYYCQFYDGADTLAETAGTAWRVTEFARGIEGYLEIMAQQLEDGFGADAIKPVNVLISGEEGSGRYTTAKIVSDFCGFPLVTAEYGYLLQSSSPRVTVRRLVRECLLTGGCLCLRNITKSADGGDAPVVILTELQKEYAALGCRPLLLCLSPAVKPLHALAGRSFLYSCERLMAEEAHEIWNYYLGDRLFCQEVDTWDLAVKMRLTPGQIVRVAENAEALFLANPETAMNNSLIYRLCYQVLDDGRYDNIKRVRSGFTLDDLKVSERNKEILRKVCNQVVYRQRVFEEWNMQKKYTYGRCVSLLMAGPPGTGKTMAVHALSSELGLELYKVDLSQIVDKYIGETEKRLEEVFNRAEKSNMILFFDEADAVLGKRSETKDAHDKNANTEIAYILQRMEEFDGIVILATNYLQNIDTAFMRRIRYVVNFELPDVKTRRQIWVSAFAPEVPLSEDIDFDFLAEKFELAGGNIKNIVLNATFYAAAENTAVGMKHILQAVLLENTKDKRISFTADYGEYGYLI